MNKAKTFFTFLIPFILCSPVIFGQAVEPVSSSKISIGVTFSPDYCYRRFHPKNAFAEVVAEIRDETEIPKFGYTAGLSLLYKPWNRVSFETGLYFSDKGYKTEFIGVYDLEASPSIFVNRVKASYQYYYLDIPIKLNYFILTGKVKLFASAGFSANIFLDDRTKSTFIDPAGTEYASSGLDLSPLNITVLLGAGIDYSINNRLNFRLEPIFRYAITPIADAPIKEYHYSVGANFGLYYSINN